MTNNLYSTKIPYIVIVYTLCIVITTSHIQWMCNPVRIYGNNTICPPEDEQVTARNILRIIM